MAAVHSSSKSNNNDSSSNTNSRRTGTASPGGWHFPKSGLGTPDLFYSFSGGSSSSNNNAAAAAGPSGSSSTMTSQQQQHQPAWLKPQTGAHPSTNAPFNHNDNNTRTSLSAAPAVSIKKEEADGDDDATAESAQLGEASDQAAVGSKFARDAEEGMPIHAFAAFISLLHLLMTFSVFPFRPPTPELAIA